MATVNLGRIKFVWQGAYSGATAYVADDVVSYNGSSYICILASTGNLPTNATYWSLMAQSGTDITSLAGLAQGDVLYYNGTSWVRLGAGTSGQFLKTNGSGANPAWSTVSQKLLQTQRAETTSVISNNNSTGKNFSSNNTSTSGTQIVSVSITPLSNTSHFYCWYQSSDGVTGNDVGVSAMFHGTSLVNLSMFAGYAGDVGTSSIHGIIDTTSLSGSQTIQVRNMGSANSSYTHYINADHTGSYNQGTACLTVMEIED
jgi:hypothetical protein